MLMQMQMSRLKKKWCRLAMKSGFGEAALEGRGACVEPRRGVAITRPQRGSGQLWWGVALPLLAQYLRRQRWIGRFRRGQCPMGKARVDKVLEAALMMVEIGFVMLLAESEVNSKIIQLSI